MTPSVGADKQHLPRTCFCPGAPPQTSFFSGIQSRQILLIVRRLFVFSPSLSPRLSKNQSRRQARFVFSSPFFSSPFLFSLFSSSTLPRSLHHPSLPPYWLISMAAVDPPLCAAANSNAVYLVTLTPQQQNGRPSILNLFKSQQNPTSLDSIVWTELGGSFINSVAVGQSLPIDSNGYWCSVDDSGAFAILSGAKDNSAYSNPFSQGRIQGLFFNTPQKTNSTSGPVFGGPGVPAYLSVQTNIIYPCIGGSCNAFLYALSSTTAGAPSNFVFASYNSSGFTFEMFDRTVNKFTTQVVSGIPSVRQQ